MLYVILYISLRKQDLVNYNDSLESYANEMFISYGAVKFAVYSPDSNIWIEYQLKEDKSFEQVGTHDYDPEMYYYDTRLQKFSLNPQLETDVYFNRHRITLGYKQDFIDLIEDDLDTTCEDGTTSSVTMNQYKIYNKYYRTTQNNKTHPHLYFECTNGKWNLNKCLTGTFFNGSKCAKPLKPAAFKSPAVSSDMKKLHTTVNGSFYLINCENSVNKDGTSCNDIECKKLDGWNFNKHTNIYSSHLKFVPYDSGFFCREGKIKRSANCTFNVISGYEENFGHYSYPSHTLNENGKCIEVTYDMLRVSKFYEKIWQYRGLENTLYAKLTKDGVKIVQRFNSYTGIRPVFTDGLITVSSNKTKHTSPVRQIVYKKCRYPSLYRHEKNIHFRNVNNFKANLYISPKGNVYIVHVGDTILDITVRKDNWIEDNSLESMYNNALNVIADDFFHIPSMFYFVLHKPGIPFLFTDTKSYYKFDKNILTLEKMPFQQLMMGQKFMTSDIQLKQEEIDQIETSINEAINSISK